MTDDWKDPEGKVKEELEQDARLPDDCINTTGYINKHECCRIVVKLKAALDIYKDDTFSRRWLKEMLK